MKVLQELKDISLYWMYDLPVRERGRKAVFIPDEIALIAEGIPVINGLQALQVTANVWQALLKLPRPFPSLKRLIPAVCSFWNAVKGGSDTTTKLLDDRKVRVPKVHLNTETAALTRITSLLLVLVHRLLQIQTSRHDYKSLAYYRNAASHRISFHETLLTCTQVLEEEIEGLQKGKASPQPLSTNENGQRKNPQRKKVGGLIPTPLTFGATLPSKTPTKLTKSVLDGTASAEVKHMINRCLGQPMQAYPIEHHNCAICGNVQTSWYCAGCKRWMCISGRDTNESKQKKNKQVRKFQTYLHFVRGNPKYFHKCCFHQAHEAAWARYNEEDKENK